MMAQSKPGDPINVIEIRRAKNGWVISALMTDPMSNFGSPAARAFGYATYVVESDNPIKVGEAIAQAIADHKISFMSPIPPARELP